MTAATLPPNEEDRLAELARLGVLDTMPEQAYDDITYLASQICDTPIALVSLVDADRQWFKSRIGLDAQETHRDLAFCAHAILEPESLMVVPDATADDRFSDNPLVNDDPSIRFYAGAPLVSGTGSAFGTLCVIDRVPRDLTSDQERGLSALSRQVMAQFELRGAVRDLREAAGQRQAYQEQLEVYQQRLEQNLASATLQSVTDELTGLKNRRALMDRLDDELERTRRYSAPLSMAMIDVDHFKKHNDTNGHAAGDAALVAVAGLVSRHSRAADFVARYGGDEFAVLLPNTDADGALVLGERFRAAVEKAEWPVTISVGVATVTGGAAAAYLPQAADRALYRAKESGRNLVVLASPDDLVG